MVEKISNRKVISYVVKIKSGRHEIITKVESKLYERVLRRGQQVTKA